MIKRKEKPATTPAYFAKVGGTGPSPRVHHSSSRVYGSNTSGISLYDDVLTASMMTDSCPRNFFNDTSSSDSDSSCSSPD